uniref:DUF3535 domain-containing protein n=1 Tax=Haemonchus placei TaxID=6290 RepID=A0A158QQ36_HAEPC
LMLSIYRLLPLLADQRWQYRHGAAIAIAKILSTSYSSMYAPHLNIYLLLGRTATAPVRETCAQALGHFLRKTDSERQTVILSQLRYELQNWHCRQSALLVFKYFFAVASSSESFHDCFNLVVKSLDDTVDDVVSCAVTTLSSLLSNPTVDDERSSLVQQVMSNVWQLLEQESKKEQLRSGLDALAVDLISIVETWLRLQESDVLTILKLFYRVLLFSAPANDMLLLENVYITSKVEIRFRSTLIESRVLLEKLGPWAGCLLLDHRSAVIDVFTYCVDSRASSRDDPFERMASEEVRCLSDKEKDDVYITRKIISAKFLATIIHLHYESGIEVIFMTHIRPFDIYTPEAIQLLFVPFLRSNLLYHNLGAAVMLNEWWAAVYRDSLNNPPPSYISFLIKDCKEFVDYCVNRGVDRSQLCMGDSVSAEEISKMAFERCLGILTAPNHIESLTTRYNVLADTIEFTKLAVKTNTARVTAFLASALFYFGFAPEKLTPMVRPLVECMQNEHNSTVSAEIFRGAVTLMIAYSWPRSPRPYVKVLARAMDMFSSCSSRIPKPQEWYGSVDCLPHIQYISAQVAGPRKKFTEKSIWAFEFPYEFQELLSRLALHDCMWSRVGSSLSDVSTSRIIELLKSSNPAYRFAGAKAVETFARSRLGDTISRLLSPLSEMLNNVSVENERRGAIEALLRLSFMHAALTGVVSLLAPLAFVRMTDKLEEVRDAAGEAFRNMVPLLALEDVSTAVPDLSDEFSLKRVESADFVNVLSAPGRLALVETKTIHGLCKTIQLRHYQAEGITWMRFLRKFGLHGILADDMGLGKTLQTLCALALSLDNDTNLISRCSLIICPRTLVDHWCNEWRRFFPGRAPARHVEGMPVKWKSAEIVVAAYEDLKANSSLGRIAWNYVVLDEGHVLRNPKTAIWRAANELNSTSRLILSGTPVQNSPADLWALFTWLMPGYLGDERHFRSRFLRKILKCRSHRANERDIQDGSEAISQLHRLILPFIMRRLKSEVLRELPDKNVQDYECQLSEEQRTIYKFIVDRCTANRTQLAARRGISPLHALMALRQLVDHPLLIQDVLMKLAAPEEIMKLVPNASSGKIAALGQLLSECGIGVTIEEKDPEDENPLSSIPVELPHRALIFCQWKSSVQLVSNALTRLEYNFELIGGVGLNLTGADVVIFLDHDWNPMKDLQAIDRAHRIGQTRKVNVYRLITQGTIEAKVMSLHKFKQDTADALIGADNRSLQTMATDELMNMFVLDGDQPSKENGGPEAKKRRKTARWNLAELWDESQYEQQFDVSQFIKEAV